MSASGAKSSAPRRATVVASTVALCLVLAKAAVGLISGSMALVASAVDSGLDFLVSLFNYLAIRQAEHPSDARFNYGRGKIKALASVFEGLIIAVSSVFIFGSAVFKLWEGAEVHRAAAAITAMAAATVVTAALVFYLNGVARRTGDMVIKTDALHYKVDLWSNLGILLALFLISRTGWHWVDPVISIGIAVYIFREAYGLVREGALMLLDRALDDELVEEITHILKEAKGNINHRLSGYHLLKTRRADDINFVDVHLVFDKEISLWEAHGVSEDIEERIKNTREATWVINCHLDPVDDREEDAREISVV